GFGGQRDVRATAEKPLAMGKADIFKPRKGEFGGLGGSREETTELPVARAICGEVETPILCPSWLGDTLMTGMSTNSTNIFNVAVHKVSKVKLGPSPGHLWMVPLEPTNVVAIEAPSRRRIKVSSLHKSGDRVFGGIDCNQTVDHVLGRSEVAYTRTMD
ncbi:MAG: hypothetical protein Q9157_003030, partial [Trypethelium eluteriae]